MTVMTRLRPFTTNIFNPIFRRIAAWVPGFGILEYLGRKSGRTYRIPVMRFRRGSEFVLCLVFPPRLRAVRQRVAAGGARIRIRRQTTRLADPKVVVDPNRRLLPRYARPLMSALRVKEFMTMQATGGQP